MEQSCPRRFVRKIRVNCRKIASLTMSAVSSTFETHQSVQSEERHFALVEGFAVAFALPTKARLVIGSRSGTQSDPCISSVTTSIMITTSNSPVKGSGIPNQLLGVGLHTIAISGLSRVSIRACCPRNFMKITQSRRQNGRGFGAARLISQWRS